MNALLVGALLCWAVLEVHTARRNRGDDTSADRGSRYLVVAGYLAGVAAALAVSLVTPAAGAPGMWLAAGLCLMGAGVEVRIWAIDTLGPWFTYDVRVELGQHLVTTGPYRWMRHPSYTGALLAAAGVGVALGSPLTVVAALTPPLLAVRYRVRLEESALRRAFGPAWAAYARRTPRYVPAPAQAFRANYGAERTSPPRRSRTVEAT